MNIIHVEAGVRYAEDAEVNGVEDDAENPKMPFLDRSETYSGEFVWKIDINDETGEIIGWKEQHPDVASAKTFYKVCDCCKIKYGNIDYYDYVPKFLCLDDSGYGDYMDLTIVDGVIQKWNQALVKKFVESVTED